MPFSKTLILKMGQVTRDKFGHESNCYRLGFKTYKAICLLLRSLRVPARFFENDYVLIKKIVHQSLEFKLKKEGKHIVFFSTRGWPKHLMFELLLAARLRMDGHRVTFLSCFDSLPLCMFGSINHPPELQRNCEACMAMKKTLWEGAYPVEYLPLSKNIGDSIEDQIEQLNLNGCRNFVYDKAPYGNLAYRGIVWYLRKSRLSDNDLATYRMTLIGAHTVRRGLEEFLSRNRVNSFVMINGDFCSEKTASWVLLQKGIRFITHDYTFHNLLALGVNRSVWDDLSFQKIKRYRQMNINDFDRNKAEKILLSWRKHGGYQGYLFWPRRDLKVKEDIRQKFNINSRPLAVAYTNLTFESSVIGKDRIFLDQFNWLNKLINFFKIHPEFQLIIRSHPAEVRQSHWKPNESLYSYIINEISDIPKNIRVISPDDKTSSYSIGMLADCILVYSSTLGMELADRRKTVITAAHVHYSQRGFTIDPESESEYFASVRKALQNRESLSKRQRQRLVDYVAWLFSHRLTSFEAIKIVQEELPRATITISDIKELSSSRYPGIHKIARLISDGTKWW